MLSFDEYEARRFGIRTARAELSSSDSLIGLLNECIAENVIMLTVRCPVDAIQIVHQMEKNEFELMDTLVYYRCILSKELSFRDDQFAIRHCRPDDVASIEAIAEAAFKGHISHYHTDPKLDTKLADGAFIEWARRSCLDRSVADEVLIPEIGGTITGFAAVRLNSNDEGDGVLFAVHPKFSGRGILGQLIERSKRWCYEREATAMVYSTQLNNYRVQQSLVNRGFHLYKACYTYHKWFSSNPHIG